MRVNKIFFITVFMRAFTTGIVNARTLCIAKIRHAIAIFGMLVGMGLPVLSQAANNCTGATYYDATNDTCVACPAGYTYNTDAGKTSINQCQTHCAAGTYVEKVLPSAYTKLEYIAGTGTQYITTNLSGFSGQGGAPEFYVKWMRTANPKSDYEAVFRVYQSETHNTYRIISSAKSRPTNYLFASNTVATGGNAGAVLANNVIHTGVIRGKFALVDGVEYNPWKYGSTLPANAKLQILGQPAFVGRIYALKVWKGGNLFADFIPARRNSDNVVGMYDAVNNVFYGNSGSGTFVAGPVDACYDAGFGYWAPESVVNYGDVGVHNACPVGTYSDVLNAGALQECKTCTGTTYNATTGARVCSECPAGYNYNTDSGKTAAAQCQISCGRGQYVSKYTKLEYLQSNGYQRIMTNLSGFDTSNWHIDVSWMLTGLSPNNYYGYVVGVYESEEHNTYRILADRSSTTRYYVNANSRAGDTQEWFNNISANTIHYGSIDSGSNWVGIDGTYVGTTTRGTTLSPETKLQLFNDFVGRIYHVNVDKAGAYQMKLIPVRRDADGVLGMYDTITGTFYTNSGTGSFTAGPVVSGDSSGLCTDVMPGYWSAGSITNYGNTGTRNACPVGTTTVGFGHGADEANDCGPSLHIGEHVIYMRANRQTSPALHIKMPSGNIYYGNMSSTDHNLSRLHLAYGGNQYTVYDESLLNTEREF